MSRLITGDLHASFYNARDQDFHSVASTFWKPAQFDELARSGSSVLIGTKGSGKTTLLKMLHPIAIAAYNSLPNAAVRLKVPFSAIYLPTGRLIFDQMDALAEYSENDIRKHICPAIIHLTILSSFLEGLRVLAREDVNDPYRITLSNQTESAICHELAYSTGSGAADLFEIQKRIWQRLIWDLRGLTSLSEDDCRYAVRNEPKLQRTLKLNAFTNMNSAMEVLTSNVKALPPIALLFDEVELAPKWLILQLKQILRNPIKGCSLKVALNPNVLLADELLEKDPSPGNEYLPIPLWHSDQKERLAFGRGIITRLLQKAGVHKPGVMSNVVFLEQLFQSSVPTRNRKKRMISPYAPGGQHYEAIKELEEWDISFRTFLQIRSLDIDLYSVYREDRKAQIRKLTRVVDARLRKLKPRRPIRQQDGRSTTKYLRLKSAKTLTFFDGGVEDLIEKTDCNPRHLVLIMFDLLKNRTDEVQERHLPFFTVTEQNAAFEKLIARHRTYLETVAVKWTNLDGEVTGNLYQFAQLVAKEIADEVFGDVFNPEPVTELSWTSRSESLSLEQLLRMLNKGLLVPVDGEITFRKEDVRRYRLNGIVSTELGVPYFKSESRHVDDLIMKTPRRRRSSRKGDNSPIVQAGLPLDGGE